jgi:prepilin-type N-terminal cleavage/methylation domain-containing protein
MKIFPLKKAPGTTVHTQGFTLVEMMITMTIFSFVVLALIGLQLFAMKVYTLGATMLSATTGGRQTMNVLRDEIRAAKNVYVGTYDPAGSATFVQTPNGSPQRGNALEINYTNDSGTNFLIFYQSTSRTNISYFSNSSATAFTNTPVKILANFVTNYYCFFAEDYQGNVETNYQNNPVIHVIMQFYQWEYPIGIIGGGAANSYNSYVLNARVSRRARQ